MCDRHTDTDRDRQREKTETDGWADLDGVNAILMLHP